MMIDEIGLLLNKPGHHQGFHALADQRHPEEDRAVASACWKRPARASRWMWSREEEGGDESISIERLTDRGRQSPSSAWWTPPSLPRCSGAPATFTSRPATTRWSSSTALTACCSQAMPPIGKEHHSTIISRIKVMSELDISRAPGAAGRPLPGAATAARSGLIDFRVSIMPSIHGEDAVLRVLDKESMSEKFHSARARRGRL